MFRSLHIDGDDFDQLVKQPANQYHLPAQKADYLAEVDRLSASEYAAITEAISGISTFQLNPFEKAEGGSHEFIHRIEFEIQTPDHHQKKIVLHELIFVKDHWKAGGGIVIEEIY